MYLASVLLFMLVLPVLSVLIEGLALHSSLALFVLIARWFVFWAVGARLFTAGVRQAIDPRFTAEKIFEFKSSEPLIIIRELGFANLALGAAGLLTIFDTAWLLPITIAGALFYGLATLQHIERKNKNPTERIATISDAFLFVALLACLVSALI